MEMTKKTKITGIVLAVILLLMSINSSVFFLGQLKVSIIQWLVFNACVPSSVAYLIGLILYFKTKNKLWLAIAVVPIFFFGTMGMFVFPWNGHNIIAQVSHIVMTLNMIWGLYVILQDLDYKALGLGLLLSVIVFTPFITFTQSYCRSHAEEVEQVLDIK